MAEHGTDLTGTQSGKLLTYEEAAELLGCTPRLVRKLVETRQMDSIKVARLVRIEHEGLERYKDAHRRRAVR
jgi:excisionase family DNA binding protein